MQSQALNKLVAEMIEKRRQQQEYCLRLKQSAFTFKTGLLNVQRNLVQTAERFSALTGQSEQTYRRAS